MEGFWRCLKRERDIGAKAMLSDVKTDEYCHEGASVDIFLYIHEVLSQSQRSCFVSTSIPCNSEFRLPEIFNAVEGFYC